MLYALKRLTFANWDPSKSYFACYGCYILFNSVQITQYMSLSLGHFQAFALYSEAPSGCIGTSVYMFL